MTFTEQQLDNFAKFKAVQQSGRFNMVTDAPQAQKATGLTKDEYWFTLGRCSELRMVYSRGQHNDR